MKVVRRQQLGEGGGERTVADVELENGVPENREPLIGRGRGEQNRPEDLRCRCEGSGVGAQDLADQDRDTVIAQEPSRLSCADERVPEGTVDVTRALATLRSVRPAALVLIAPPRLVGIVAAQLPAAWPKAHVVGFDTLDPEGLNAEGREGLEGATFITTEYALVGAVRDSFESRYQRAYGEPPTRMGVRGYLAGLAVARGIDAGSLNAAMLREALRSQVYDSEEGRTFRALRPQAQAEPEQLTIHAGKAVSAATRLRP